MAFDINNPTAGGLSVAGVDKLYLPFSSSASSSSSGTTSILGGGLAALPTRPAPPVAPNTSNLSTLLNTVQRQDAIKKAMKDYDDLTASTRSGGFQAASNAGSSYASRLMQSGVNPTGAGVVAAQAKTKVYDSLAQITQQKDATRLDAVNKSQALAAQIASAINNIQLSYSKTLADFNQQQFGYELNLNEFNAGQSRKVIESDRDYNMRQQVLAAQLAASSGSGAEGGSGGATSGRDYPGYIPNSGPLDPQVINGIRRFNSPTVNVGNATNGRMGGAFFTPGSPSGSIAEGAPFASNGKTGVTSPTQPTSWWS